MKKIILLCLILSSSLLVLAQEGGSVTKKWNAKKGSPKASITDVEWISGHWRGEAFGGMVEEIWSPASGGSMMASFKLVVEGETKFYELISIAEENKSLILRLKHFHTDLRGWEPKDESVVFKLVEIQENWAHFDGMSFEKVDENHINVYVVLDGEAGEKEMPFAYTRYGTE